MEKHIEQWKIEWEHFEKWFKDLGGNIANTEKMQEAFLRIEAKVKIDNNLYKILEENK